MKLYTTKPLSYNNLNNFNKKSKNYSILISNEGIFKINDENKKIKKLIIKNDNVEYFNENNIDLILDKSIIEYIDYDKIPYMYTKTDMQEEIFIINDDVNIIYLNNKIWYIEFYNKSHLDLAKSIILKNV